MTGKLQESDSFGRFFDDLGTLVESLQRGQSLARTNAAERQRLIAKIRHAITQIRFWQPQTTDAGDQILLEIALEDLTELLQSFGLTETRSMRELIDIV